VSSPDSSNNNALLAQILQVLTALVDISNAFRESTKSRPSQIENPLLSVARESQGQTQLQGNALARPTDQGSAAEPVSRQMLQVERSWLWSLETGVSRTRALRLPRPSIIGRALYDLQHEAESDAASVYEGSKPADIYIKISVKGGHHLSETPSKYVTRYIAGETSDMSGAIGRHLEARFKVLTPRIAGRILAGRSGELRCLTGHGNYFFANWPNWDALDDDLTGYGPSTSGPAPPASGAGAT